MTDLNALEAYHSTATGEIVGAAAEQVGGFFGELTDLPVDMATHIPKTMGVMNASNVQSIKDSKNDAIDKGLNVVFSELYNLSPDSMKDILKGLESITASLISSIKGMFGLETDRDKAGNSLIESPELSAAITDITEGDVELSAIIVNATEEGILSGTNSIKAIQEDTQQLTTRILDELVNSEEAPGDKTAKVSQAVALSVSSEVHRRVFLDVSDKLYADTIEEHGYSSTLEMPTSQKEAILQRANDIATQVSGMTVDDNGKLSAIKDANGNHTGVYQYVETTTTQSMNKQAISATYNLSPKEQAGQSTPVATVEAPATALSTEQAALLANVPANEKAAVTAAMGEFKASCGEQNGVASFIEGQDPTQPTGLCTVGGTVTGKTL